MALLEILDGRFGFRIEHVGQRGEGSRLRIEEKTTLLEQNRNGLLPARIVMNQGADLSRARVSDGDDLDQLGGVDRSGPGHGEERVDVDTPFCHQPQKGLECNDSPRPNECPFLALDILVVALGGKVEGKERGPDDQKRPDISVQINGERVMQRGIFDLGIINEFRPVAGVSWRSCKHATATGEVHGRM